MKNKIKNKDNYQQKFLWMEDIQLADVWDKGDGKRVIYFDGATSLLSRFRNKYYPKAVACAICIEYPLNEHVNESNCLSTVSPVYILDNGDKESPDWDYIKNISFEEIQALIQAAENSNPLFLAIR